MTDFIPPKTVLILRPRPADSSPPPPMAYEIIGTAIIERLPPDYDGPWSLVPIYREGELAGFEVRLDDY